MQSVTTIFEALGGPTKMARVLDVGISTASEMKRRKSIPVKYWPKLVEAGAGITYEQLVSAHLESAQ
jgi:hypothetical protein